MRVAVIGAGLSGLVAARSLQPDHDVTVFEKSRGPGGRMATRYEDGFEFDHGTQFFTARSPDFREFLEPLLQRGVVRSWNARFAELDRGKITSRRDWDAANPHFVGVPGMNAVGKFLGAGLAVHRNTRITRLQPCRGGWQLRSDDDTNLGRFDWVILALPAEQTRALAPEDSRLREVCESVTMKACFAVMLGFEEPLQLPWDAALVRGADISWASVNSSKPGRADDFTLVVHSTNAYADAHVDDEIEAVQSHLLAETSGIVGAGIGSADVRRLQRWRYANVDRQDGRDCFVDEKLRLGACGDWFIRGRVEAAFTSGFSLARLLKAQL